MFKTEKNFTYMMPVHFGGNKVDRETKYFQKVVSLMMSYETDKKLLENFIPEEFELTKGEIQVSFGKYTEIDWLSGGMYNLISITAPVRFDGKREQIEAPYTLIMWENKTAPILTGREQTGIPKLYADIEDLHIYKPYYSTTASYE